jgi:hypothetical protein
VDIPFADIKGRVLVKVLDFMFHHVDNPFPAIQKVRLTGRGERGGVGRRTGRGPGLALTPLHAPSRPPADPVPVQPLRSSNISDLVPEWDAHFVDIDNEFLFELILAANFMDIKELLDLTCGKVAAMVRNKSTEEIRREFHIQNDFSPEEEQLMALQEQRWAEQQKWLEGETP